jgi:hypothetical protein
MLPAFAWRVVADISDAKSVLMVGTAARGARAQTCALAFLSIRPRPKHIFVDTASHDVWAATEAASPNMCAAPNGIRNAGVPNTGAMPAAPAGEPSANDCQHQNYDSADR